MKDIFRLTKNTKPIPPLVLPEKKSKSYSYSCPDCDEHPPEDDYRANKTKYPKRGKSNYFFNGEFQGYDWNEVHWCKKCKQEFWFENSSI